MADLKISELISANLPLSGAELIPLVQGGVTKNTAVSELLSNFTSELNLKEDKANKGQANGYVPLNGSSLIDAIYLPSYVDDVIEVADYASLPLTGETGKIYVTLDDNKIYRWSGSVYVEIAQSSIPSLQAVTDVGNVTTNPIYINSNTYGLSVNTTDESAIDAISINSIGVYGNSTNSSGIWGESYSNVGIVALSYLGTGLAATSNFGISAIFNIGSSSTSNILEAQKNGVNQFTISHDGLATTESLRLNGIFYDKDNQAGTSGQILSSTGTGVDWVDAPSGITNLSYTASPTNGIVASDTGTDATITLADGTNAGLLSPSHYTTLNNGVWRLTGNTGTDPLTNFIGHIDDKRIIFKTNNLQSGLIHRSQANVFFGYQAGRVFDISFGGGFGTGVGNTAIGHEALYVASNNSNNTAIGRSALYNNGSGTRNIAIGINASGLGTSHNDTIAIGYEAGINHNGNGNVLIGSNSSLASTGTGANNILIGRDTTFPTGGTSSNQINIGNFLYKLTTGELGIDTNTPTKKLDINGELRIRTRPTGLSTEDILVVNANGDVRSVTQASVNKNGLTSYDVGSGTSQAIDLSLTRVYSVDLNNAPSNVTLSFTNAIVGMKYYIKIIQGVNLVDVVLPSSVLLESGTAPNTLDITATNNAIDMLELVCISASEFLGTFKQNLG